MYICKDCYLLVFSDITPLEISETKNLVRIFKQIFVFTTTTICIFAYRQQFGTIHFTVTSKQL